MKKNLEAGWKVNGAEDWAWVERVRKEDRGVVSDWQRQTCLE